MTSVADAERAIALFLQRGCRAVIITMGAQGVVYASQSQPRVRHFPAQSVKVVDTTVSMGGGRS